MASFRAIFISDVHLGSKDSKAEALLEFLRNNESDYLFLIGDIVDGWSLAQKWNWPQSHSDVIQKILRKARKGTKVHYALGNHDDFIKRFLPLQIGNDIDIDNEFEFTDQSGKRYLIVHGDKFDSLTMHKKLLTYIGDNFYMFFLRLNIPLNYLRKLFGYHQYWSLSKYLKENIKTSRQFIENYENILSDYAKSYGYDGVICGHIHHAKHKHIDNFLYLNTGDWVESKTLIVEKTEGGFELIEY